MKHLMTLAALFVSSLAMAQWPSLPYNPDDNADGLIGVADLQALLANYGNEFASAVVSEDGESAIVYMGEIGYPQCKYSCDHLPGFWSMPFLDELVPVWDEIQDGYTWLNNQDIGWLNNFTGNQYMFPEFGSHSGSRGVALKSNGWEDKRCYCAAKQLPRVEYSYCLAAESIRNVEENDYNSAAFQACCDVKVQEGWFPLGGIAKGLAYDGGQAFWRWAE